MKLLAALALVVVTGCHSSPIDDVVGASCVSDRDCAHRCFADSGRFPGGFCSLDCNSDADCPDGTACVSSSGGVCMFLCTELDCAELGAGWQCNDKDRQADGGKVNVCIGD